MSLDLTAIEQRANAATPGPWVNDGAEIYADIIGGQWIGETLRLDDPTSESDAEFIAHARQDVDDLLAEVKRLTKGIEDTVATLRAAAMAEGGQPAYSFAAGLNDGLQLATARLRALLDGPR